jgi:hypothetical protein
MTLSRHYLLSLVLLLTVIIAVLVSNMLPAVGQLRSVRNDEPAALIG